MLAGAVTLLVAFVALEMNRRAGNITTGVVSKIATNHFVHSAPTS